MGSSLYFMREVSTEPKKFHCMAIGGPLGPADDPQVVRSKEVRGVRSKEVARQRLRRSPASTCGFSEDAPSQTRSL